LLYILDTNVLINAKNYYYPIDRIPQFWGWLIKEGNAGRIKIPIEVDNEIKQKNDDLKNWISQEMVQDALLLDEEPNISIIRTVLEKGYYINPSNLDLEKLKSADPFIISYALMDKESRCIITKEVSKPSKKGANRKIPDVCESLKISWGNDFDLYKALDFRIP